LELSQSIIAPIAPATPNPTPIILAAPVSTAPFLVAEVDALEVFDADADVDAAVAADFDTDEVVAAVAVVDAVDVVIVAAVAEAPPPAAPATTLSTPLCTLLAKLCTSLGRLEYQVFVVILERSPLRKEVCHFVGTAVETIAAIEVYWDPAVTCVIYVLTLEAMASDWEGLGWDWALVRRGRRAMKSLVEIIGCIFVG